MRLVKAGTATQAFAGTLVIAGAEAGPGRRMAGSWETRHVAPEFGDDRLDGAAGHPRDGVEARDRVGFGGGARRDAAGDRHEVLHGSAMRGEGGPDRGVQLGDRRLQRRDHPQVCAQQDAMMRPDVAGQRRAQRGPLRAQPRVSQRDQALGIGFARRQGRDDRAPTDAEQRAEHRGELHVGTL
jgi:hypothetical protein